MISSSIFPMVMIWGSHHPIDSQKHKVPVVGLRSTFWAPRDANESRHQQDELVTPSWGVLS